MGALGHCIKGSLFVLITLLILMTRGAAKSDEQKAERRRGRPHDLCFAVGLLTFAGIEFWGAAHPNFERGSSGKVVDVLVVLALLSVLAGTASRVLFDRGGRRRP